LPIKTIERVAVAIDDLAENPRPQRVKKLESSENYRIAVGASIASFTTSPIKSESSR